MSDPAVQADGAPLLKTEASPTDKKPSQYYYWHGHEKERAKLGDVAPKTTPALVGTAAADHSPLLKQMSITKYSWCDNKSSVSVYVDFDGATSENTVVELHKKKLRVTVRPSESSPNYVLLLFLAKEVDDSASSFRFKPNQVVIKLAKTDEVTWYDLIDSKASLEDEE